MADGQPGVNNIQLRAAVFLVLAAGRGPDDLVRVRGFCGDVDKLVRAVAARDSTSGLSCVVGLGSDIWSDICGDARPAELHLFHELSGGPRQAPSTPGDLLLHIASERFDLCYELAKLILRELGNSVSPLDEIHGFRYFDDRDLIGFVDGTENPTGDERVAATLVGNEDAEFAGGAYVIVQKYLHDLAKWDAVPVPDQERVIGRTKLEDVELDDTVKPSYAHNALTTLVENGEEIKILRHNMPFGDAAGENAGTYFIGYARSPRPIEQMLENMFLGKPEGNYDRLLDFTRPVTGTNFFAPSVQFLAALAAPPPAAAPREPAPPARPAGRSGSLVVGGLKGVPQHE